jgi:hypothetical protein
VAESPHPSVEALWRRKAELIRKGELIGEGELIREDELIREGGPSGVPGALSVSTEGAGR